MACIKFENVSLQYPIYSSKSMSIRNKVLNLGTGGLISASSGDIITVTALDNVSFSIKKGDSVGLVGHNGAGKSTLLRLMAGIYKPSNGNVVIEGSIATVFELGAGMDVELSGYENIVRMLMLMGHSFSEAKNTILDIEDFTELGDFLNLPVRTYSSGMIMRLMFAVSTSLKPSILLIDEMFGVGDSAFQEKAQVRMHKWISEAEIFVFASHDYELIKKTCNKVYRLEHGKIYFENI